MPIIKNGSINHSCRRSVFLAGLSANTNAKYAPMHPYPKNGKKGYGYPINNPRIKARKYFSASIKSAWIWPKGIWKKAKMIKMEPSIKKISLFRFNFCWGLFLKSQNANKPNARRFNAIIESADPKTIRSGSTVYPHPWVKSPGISAYLWILVSKSW